MATTKNQEAICTELVNEIARWIDKDIDSKSPLIRLRVNKRIEEALNGKMTAEHAESVAKRMTDMFLLIRQYRIGTEHPKFPF